MASSDEDDVCIGPLTLNDIRKALNVMDPFRKVSCSDDKLDMRNVNQANMCAEEDINLTRSESNESLADVLIIDSSNQDFENVDCVNKSFKGSDPADYLYAESDKTLSDSLMVDPLHLSPNNVFRAENYLESSQNKLHEMKDQKEEFNEKHNGPLTYNYAEEDPILLDVSSECSISAQELPSPLESPKPIAKNSSHVFSDTKNWFGLLNNITNANILDQTEPEYLQQTMENTILQDAQILKNRKYDLTIIEQPEWQNDSVTSFEALELITRSPVKITAKVTSTVMMHSSSDISQSTSAYDTARQSSFETSSESHIAKENFMTAQNTSADSESTKASAEINNSLDFDNTFEEMRYYLELDTKLKDNGQLKTPEQSKSIGCPYPNFSPVTPTDDTSSAKASPLSARRIRKKEFYPISSPLKSSDCFRMPKTPTSTLSKNLPKSPLCNFDHIISPIGMYIKNAPKVPLLGTHAPGKSAGLQRGKMFGTDMSVKTERTKENIDINNSHSLPQIAYKSSTYNTMTTIKSPSLLPSLSKNDKVKKLILNTPTHKVIRHEGRVKESRLPRLKTRKSEDSFANLSVSSADLSVLVKKEAARTETIVKKNLS